jgi:UDP-N-acetylglucosamine 4,6-dehydratase/5-epimerase
LKKFIITGITGTMGSALSKHILEKIPNAYVIGISRDEQKQRAMFQHERLDLKLGDIRDPGSLRRAIGNETIIDGIYHLAALKCVDTLEHNVSEAIETNVLGTRNIVEMAQDLHCDLVMASTDKACYPINAYGNTKALAERLVLSEGFKVLRYGNVIGSRGSFIPKIIENLSAGKPIPITDVDMTRFWVKTEDIARYLLDMHELQEGLHIPQQMLACTLPVLIEAISELLEVKGYTLDVVGLRPGEKIHETLQTREEGGLLTSYSSLCSYRQIKDYLKGAI